MKDTLQPLEIRLLKGIYVNTYGGGYTYPVWTYSCMESVGLKNADDLLLSLEKKEYIKIDKGNKKTLVDSMLRITAKGREVMNRLF